MTSSKKYSNIIMDFFLFLLFCNASKRKIIFFENLADLCVLKLARSFNTYNFPTVGGVLELFGNKVHFERFH